MGILRIIIRRCRTCHLLFGPVTSRDACETCINSAINRRNKLAR